MRKLFILLALLLLLLPFASATNVTPVTVLDQPGYIPSGLFMFILASAFISLVISYKYLDEMSGFISIMAAFAAMWTSRAIDYVTGVAIDSESVITVVHTIYHPEILTFISAICFVLALLNVYRIYLISKDNSQGGNQ